VPAGNHDLLAGEASGETVKLEPFGVTVIELPAADARRDE
jgi:hypothetical protein